MREMKDSGVPWIGEIPEGWIIRKLKSVSDIIMGQSPDGDTIKQDGTLPFMQGNTEFGVSYPHPSIYCDVAPKHSRIGDILMSVRAPVGALNLSDKVYGIGRGLCSIKALGLNSRFLWYYLLKSQDDFKIYSAGSTFEAITTKILMNWTIVLPPLKEQVRIVELLDLKCQEIDFLLKELQVSIRDYKRLKRSLISDTVIKGVDRRRKMKDSGSVWFETIPSTWNLKRLKYLFSIEKRIAGETGHTVLAITQKGIVPKTMENGSGQFAEDYSNYQLVFPGDFAMNHMDLLTGWVDISKYAGVTSPDYRVFTIKDTTSTYPAYYLYFMQMCYLDRIFYGLGQGVSGMGRWRLQADKFLNFRIPVPPMEEQQEIAAYLDEKCAAIDSLIASKETLITELEAYKKSIIYEYVTGKKEV